MAHFSDLLDSPTKFTHYFTAFLLINSVVSGLQNPDGHQRNYAAQRAPKDGITLPPPFYEDCVTDAYPPNVTRKWEVPTYKLDLDKPPIERWQSIVKPRTGQILNMINSVIDLFGHGEFRDIIDAFVDISYGELDELLPSPYNEEIKGVSKATGIALGKIVIFNLFYDVSPMCTSIVAQGPLGNVYHARNLDFGEFLGWNNQTHEWTLTENLREMIMHVEYQKANKTVYTVIHYAGYIGGLSVVKKNAFSLTVNSRNVGERWGNVLSWYFKHRERQFNGFVVRDLLEKASNYSEAKIFLEKVPLVSSVFFILAGTKFDEGCTMARNMSMALDVWNLNGARNTWFVFETNYDRWKPVDIFDDRRTPTRKCLNKMGQTKVSLANLFNVLQTKPVLNKATTYTTLLQPKSGHFETYIRWCPDPCWFA